MDISIFILCYNKMEKKNTTLPKKNPKSTRMIVETETKSILLTHK
jgi:hypothetical protein